jgi:hypothetical protein
MTQADRTASEFGGVPGPIQPEPHVPTAAEQARIERNTEDNERTPDSLEASRERGGARRAG